MESYTKNVICSELTASAGVFAFVFAQSPQQTAVTIPGGELGAFLVFTTGMMWRSLLKALRHRPDVMGRKPVVAGWSAVTLAAFTVGVVFVPMGVVSILEAAVVVFGVSVLFATAVGSIESRDDWTPDPSQSDENDSE